MATDPPSGELLEIIETVGPVFSDAGLRNWDLCLARDIIIACPRGLWLTVKTGILAGLGLSDAIAKVWARPPGSGGRRVLADTGDPAWRRYPVSRLQGVACVRSAGANEIQLRRPNAEPDVYGLGDRSQTDACREVLRRLYGILYREEGFG